MRIGGRGMKLGKKKGAWGGHRPGSGRPEKEPGIKRVRLDTRIHPDTLAMIDAEREKTGKSRGEVIDEKFYLPSRSGR
jgi:hypothetical protein